MIPLLLLLQKLMQMFAVMLLAFLVVKLNIVKSSDSFVLSKLSLYLLMPATILCAFDVEITDQIKSGILLAFGIAIALHMVFLIIDLIYKKLYNGTKVERASIMYSNAANLIIPIVSFVLGKEWVIYSCAFLSVQLFFLWTHGAHIFSNDNTINWKKILLNVNIIAILCGVLLMSFHLRLPTFIHDTASSLGDMLGTVGMIIAGMTMANVDFKTTIRNKRLYLVLLMRMIVVPLICVFLLRGILLLLHLPNAEKILLVSLLACITPSASSVMQFAQIYKEDDTFAVSVNVATSLVSMITMPLFVWLYFLF